MRYEIREDVSHEAATYLMMHGTDQVTLQAAREQLRWFRLGRQDCTPFEQELVEVVYSADKIFKQQLSATLRANRKTRGNH